MGMTAIKCSGKPRNARELIVLLLADRTIMTLRQLHVALRKHGYLMSLQAVLKHLRILIEDGQVSKIAHGEYRIAPEWISELRRFCDVMERNLRDCQLYEEGR